MITLPAEGSESISGSTGVELRSDPRWQLVERILLTAPFQKSSNLYALLHYLAEHSIQGHPEALTERQIGRAAFGKPQDYSPAEDSVVRVYVRQLRLRLHEYFGREGRHETLLADIPKGSYVLEFRPAEIEHRPAVEPPYASVPQPAVPAKKRWTALEWVLLVTLVTTGVCGVGWYRAAHRPFFHGVPWPLNTLVGPDVDTRIVVSDGSSMLRLLNNKEITLDEYVQPGFRRSMIPSRLDPDVSRLVNYISDSQLTSIADLAVATALVRLAGPAGQSLRVYPAQDLNLRDLALGNYVFVGSSISNPWVSLFSDKLNFEVVEDGVGGKMYFRNKNPLPGEQPTYDGLLRTGSDGEEYATISLVPGTDGHGKVLIIQGLRQEGTEAVAELLQNAEDRENLEETLRASNHGRDPQFFEALIRSRAVAGAPVSINIVSTRIIQSAPAAH